MEDGKVDEKEKEGEELVRAPLSRIRRARLRGRAHVGTTKR